jgi:copper transport protein
MSPVRRLLACVVVALAIVAGSAGPALAHATLLGSTPAANARGVSEQSTQVVLHFSEPVQVLNRSDVTIVNDLGFRIDTGRSHTAADDPTRVLVAVRGPLLPASYTVRYRVVSQDSHSEVAAYVFAVGGAPLGSPILAGSGGLTDESPIAVASRVVEFAALMLLLGLVAFRMLVWGPAVASAAGLSSEARERALLGGGRLYWRAFWALAAFAGIAETLVLAAKSAVVFHKSIFAAVAHPAVAYRFVAASRFGDLLGWRCAALCALVAVAFLTWNAETAGRVSAAARRWPSVLMALLGVTALTLLAAQGHAAQAPLAPLSIAFDAVHLTAVSIWIAGLVALGAVLLRAPRALPEGGRALASATLSRFSRIALWSVCVIAVTGVARATGELDSPLQLLSTGYGRSLMLKTSLLAPILVIARGNHRLVRRLASGWTPDVAKLRSVARAVQAELAIAMAIVVVAAVLVAQIPGRA